MLLTERHTIFNIIYWKYNQKRVVFNGKKIFYVALDIQGVSYLMQKTYEKKKKTSFKIYPKTFLIRYTGR